jgi:hypothetical protein
MTAPQIAAMFFTVALLVTTAYFILGSVPLLVLKHDTPMDSRFVRMFFNTYYRAAMYAASAAAVSYALAERPGFALEAAALAILAVVLRRSFIPKMEALGAQITSSGADAVQRFRRMHILAIAINVAQLALVVWTLIAFSMK